MRDKGEPAVKLMQSNFKDAYWTLAQMVAHHTVNGCSMQRRRSARHGHAIRADGGVGGRLADRAVGWRQERRIELPGGEKRTFLQDGDTVILRGFCEKRRRGAHRLRRLRRDGTAGARDLSSQPAIAAERLVRSRPGSLTRGLPRPVHGYCGPSRFARAFMLRQLSSPDIVWFGRGLTTAVVAVGSWWRLCLPLTLTGLETTRLLIAWNTGTCLFLVLAGIMFARSSNSDSMLHRAKMEDEGEWAVLALVMIAAVASVVAIVAELGGGQGHEPVAQKTGHVALAGLTVLSSWAFTHTMFAMHYAHNFYLRRAGPEGHGGLEFPDAARR